MSGAEKLALVVLALGGAVLAYEGLTWALATGVLSPAGMAAGALVLAAIIGLAARWFGGRRDED